MVELTFYSLVVFSVGGIVLLAILARAHPLDLVGEALHPFNILGFLLFIVVFDFITLFETVAGGGIGHIATISIARVPDIVSGFVFFLCCEFALIFGIYFAAALGYSTNKGQPRIPIRRNEHLAAQICMMLMLVAGLYALSSIVIISLQHGSFFYVAGKRTVFFRENLLLLMAVAILTPIYILYGSRMRLRTALYVLPFVLLFLYPVGGRSKLLYPVIAMLYWYCRVWPLPAISLYIFGPFVGIGAVFYGYFGRWYHMYPTLQQYLHSTGGIFGALFNEPTISMAEIITVNLSTPYISRSPWESLVAAIMLPVPREIVSWKPLGASTEFTMQTDLARWLLVKSEWTVTGFVNLYFDLGYFGAIMACFGLAFIWTRILTRNNRRSFGTAFVGPVSILVAYQFIRGDIYIISQFLWPLLAASVLYWVILKALDARVARSPRQTLARQ